MIIAFQFYALLHNTNKSTFSIECRYYFFRQYLCTGNVLCSPILLRCSIRGENTPIPWLSNSSVVDWLQFLRTVYRTSLVYTHVILGVKSVVFKWCLRHLCFIIASFQWLYVKLVCPFLYLLHRQGNTCMFPLSTLVSFVILKAEDYWFKFFSLIT